MCIACLHHPAGRLNKLCPWTGRVYVFVYSYTWRRCACLCRRCAPLRLCASAGASGGGASAGGRGGWAVPKPSPPFSTVLSQ